MQIDNYSLNLFKECPKIFEFRIEQQVDSVVPNLPALYGIAIHDALDTFYKKRTLIDSVKSFKESWQQFEGLDSKGLYTLARGALIITEYIHNYDNIEPLHVEIGMAAELRPGYDIVLTGRIDLVGEMDRVMYVIDHKTRSKSLNTYSIRPNYQLLGYSLGVKEHLGLEEYPPIMVNLIKVAKTYDDMVLRMTHYPSVDEIDTFIDDTIYWCAKIEECRSHEYFPRIGNEFRCAWCTYKEPCNHPTMLQRLVDNGTFVKKEWTPY